MAWDKVDFKVWTHPDGDSWARCWVRLQETREATKIVEQLLDTLPSGPVMTKVPRIIKVPEGEAWVSTENPLGEMGYYVVSKGDLGPFRVKIRSASFNNISIASWVLRGVYVPDIITILASLYFILGDIDQDECLQSLVDARVPYWGQSLLRVLGGIVAVLIPAGTIVYVFLFKMMSFMQSRLGPMEAGPYGSMQLVAEVGKWIQKEDIVPERADAPIYKIAPIIVLVSTFLLVAVVPFGPDAWFTNFDAGVFYLLAVSSISVIGILIAGWSSANKYSLLGGLRAAGQLIAYELPMVLAVVGVVIQAGSMNLQQIVVAQNTQEIFGFDGLGLPFVLTQFVGFIIFMIAIQAELTQAPFDMPIAESELVSGYMTEYSGFRFLIFFIGEFATAGVFAFIAAVLFLGGWGVPFSWFGWDTVDSVDNWMNLAGPVIMLTKMMVLTLIIMWVRFSYPRFREDQLQRFAWKVLIPLSLLNIVVTAVLKVAV